MAAHIHTEVTQRILEQLQKGVIPWRKPWHTLPTQGMPQNAISGRCYSGCNVILLWMSLDRGWTSNRYLTFRQVQQAGGFICGGEKGTRIIFTKKLAVIDPKQPEEPRMVPMLKAYTVFALEQTEGLPAKVLETKQPRIRNRDQRDPLADDFVKAIGVDVREGAGEAFFCPSRDFISMPAFAAFDSADSFYSTLWHECAHWAGHPSRLNREIRNRFGSRDYGREELCAEIAASFICAEYGHNNTQQAASYISTWIEILKDDPRAFINAASQAQRAVDYLRGLALRETPQTEEAAELAA